MTRDEILNMPAGRALDALIEHHIIKTQVPRNSDGHLSRSWVDGYGYENTFYSTDIAAAWDVVEKLKRDGFIWKSNGNESCGNLIYSFSFAKDDGGYEEYFQTFDSGITENSLPLAICRAALLAVQSTSPTHDSP